MSSSDPVKSEDLVFREARDGDLPAILALLGDDPLGKYRELALPEHAEIPAVYKVAFEAIDADPRNQLYVAESGGRGRGMLSAHCRSGADLSGRRAGADRRRAGPASHARPRRRQGDAAMRDRAGKGAWLRAYATHDRQAPRRGSRILPGARFAGSHVGMKLLM